MKKTISLLLAVCLFFSAAAVLVGVTAAWLADGLYTQRFPTDFSGSSDLAYFAGGDGTANNPYEISTPVHLYNLAWLQYLGYFNRKDGLNNDLDQTYFKLTDNVSMASFNSALPPIGTEEYPFIGHFDGNGYTVSNVTVSNTGTGKNALTIHPTAAVFDESGILRTAGNTAAVSIVGLFGVIGDIAINGASYVDTYKEGKDGFDKTAMAVGGFYADGLHIRSYTAETLCGLAAGWVGANLAHVGVYQGDFVFATGATGIAALLDDGDSATTLSKYSLVGNYDKDLVGWSSLPRPDWGGTVDMKSVHNRLVSFWNQTPKSYVDANFNDATSGVVRYYDEDKGSVYFRSSTSAGLTYLIGGIQTFSYPETTTDETGYFISYNGNYLSVTNLSATGASWAVTEKPVTWYYDDASGALYAYNGDRKLYLNKNRSGVLQISGVQDDTWQLNGSHLSTTGTYYGTTYLTCSGTNWVARDTSAQDLTMEATNTRRTIAVSYTYSGTVNGVNRSYATYFPINVDNNGFPLSTNTGYISGGSTTREGTNGKTIAGDIRTKYAGVGSSLSKSLNNAGTFGDGTTLELLTCTKTSGGFKRITDSYNSSHSSVNSALAGYVPMTVKDLSLTAYTNARDKLNALLKGQNQVYGMHFMNAQISMDNIYVAPKAVINGKTYENYEMTANSIDFQVASRGHIAFFAGTYYQGSDKNFFSLHQIFRNADKTITAIKEISKIYGTSAGKADYIYEYKLGGFSGGYTALPEGYELEFDSAWITNPEMVRYAVYYFEIPVNAGEYALGSADTGDGAYLMYLDIGANAAGSSETPSDTDYNLESVDFVNTDASGVVRDANGAVIDSSWPSYAAVVVTLSDATGTAPYIVFRRGDATGTDDSGAITAILYYRTDGTLTVAPLPKTDATEDNTTLSPPADRTTG